MTTRSGLAHYSFLALTAFAIAGCSPDRAPAPISPPPRLTQPNADLGNLTTTPVIFDKPSLITQVRSIFNAGYLADDFVVPEGSVWTVTAVALSGHLFAASLPVSIRVPDANGFPGETLPGGDATPTPIASDLNACDCAFFGTTISDYLFAVPTGIKLSAGTYWVAARIILGEFYWQTYKPVTGTPGAIIRDASGSAWQPLGTDEDFSFALFGTIQHTQTITLAPVTPNPAPLGGTATLNATASSQLTVALGAGPANVCTLSGTTLNFVGLGTCTVTADQAGNTTYLPATQVTQDIVVAKVSQAITFPAITPNPATVSSSATLGATASSGLGVSYTSLTTTVCTVTGNVVSYAKMGSCTVAANQPGNATYDPAEQATQSVDVVKIPQTITFASAAPAPAYIKGTYVVAATGGASGNPVAITVGPPNVCTVTGNTVRLVGVGTCAVTANQAGNDAYAAAAPVTQRVKVDYRYDGFLGSVRTGVMNTAKAGQTIALSWRLTDVSGAPIASLTSVKITVADLNCTLGGTAGQVAEPAAGGSGLQNLGNGYYQYNWKSPASYAKSCKTLQLDLGEGSGVRTASFAFTK